MLYFQGFSFLHETFIKDDALIFNKRRIGLAGGLLFWAVASAMGAVDSQVTASTSAAVSPSTPSASAVNASTASATEPVSSTPTAPASTVSSPSLLQLSTAPATSNPFSTEESTTGPTSVVNSTAAAIGSLSTGAGTGLEAADLEDKKIPPNAKILRLKVEGNRNVRERVILAAIKTKKLDPYDPEKLRKDVQAIYALGNFDDVTLDVSEVPGGAAVTFHVVEKPMIKKIEFKGNKKLSKGKLSDTIALKEGDPLDKLKLNVDVDKILNLYKDEGFAAAQVEPYTTKDATNHVVVTFFITEGTQVIIDNVILEGVTAFPPKKVLKRMKMRRKKVFKQDQLTKDLDEITKYYKNNGYQNIKIGDVKQDFNADKTRITLTLPITEGPLFHFGDVTFSGNAIFPADKLRPAIQFKAGEIYNQEKMDATVSRLQDIYGAQGYIRVQIKPDFHQDIAKGIVDTNFLITEGEVVYVDHIGIEGNTHTKDYVIRREIKLKEGEPFNSVLARKSVERLYNLGFLDNVDVDVQQPTSPTKADVIFTVTEGKPGILSAGAGYSSVDGLIGTLQLQHINFLGRGQRLNLQVQFGGRLQSYDLGWTEPWFMGRPMTFGVDLFRVNRYLQLGGITNAYQSRDTGVSLTAGPRFSDIYNLLFTYSVAQRYEYNVNNDPFTRRTVLGEQAVDDQSIQNFTLFNANMTEALTRDARDNQFDPTRGNKESVSLTEGGLAPGAIQYYKPVVDGSIHFPTWWKLVLSFHGEWAYVNTYGGSTNQDIVTELFRVGGSDTVRGYALGNVGSSARPDSPGAHVMNFYNVEYKFPIAPDEHGKTLLQGVLFYDIGGGWDSIHQMSYQVNSSELGLKQGVGFGIRFKTPVFPLRLDFGIPLNPAPGEARSQFYFNVGSLF